MNAADQRAAYRALAAAMDLPRHPTRPRRPARRPVPTGVLVLACLRLLFDLVRGVGQLFLLSSAAFTPRRIQPPRRMTRTRARDLVRGQARNAATQRRR